MTSALDADALYVADGSGDSDDHLADAVAIAPYRSGERPHVVGCVVNRVPDTSAEKMSVWVPSRSSTSCDLGVFVYQPTEQIATSEVKLAGRSGAGRPRRAVVVDAAAPVPTAGL